MIQDFSAPFGQRISQAEAPAAHPDMMLTTMMASGGSSQLALIEAHSTSGRDLNQFSKPRSTPSSADSCGKFASMMTSDPQLCMLTSATIYVLIKKLYNRASPTPI